MATMKRIFSVFLIFIILISVPSCNKTEEQAEQIKKSLTVYVDWFGVTIDVKELKKEISPNVLWNGPPTSFEEKLKSMNEANTEYAIVMVKCVGDWKQRAFEDDAHREQHKPYATAYLSPLYIEIPYEIIGVLEGDFQTVESGEIISVEYPGLYVRSPGMFTPAEEWKNNSSVGIKYDGIAQEFIYPRNGYEYIIILHYNTDTGCYYSSSAAAECELSSLEDLLEYYKSFYKITENSKVPTEDDYIPANYYEILERYNIKVK